MVYSPGGISLALTHLVALDQAMIVPTQRCLECHRMLTLSTVICPWLNYLNLYRSRCETCIRFAIVGMGIPIY